MTKYFCVSQPSYEADLFFYFSFHAKTISDFSESEELNISGDFDECRML